MGASAVREILKVVSQPGMISLAGGIPAPESFPMAIIEQLTSTVLTKYGPSALQYDMAEGFGPLRAALSDYLRERNIAATPDEVLVMSGSQGVLDGLGKVLISPGDGLAVEMPTYLGALSAFNPYEPTYIPLQTDQGGLIPEALDEVLSTDAVKFVYLTPTFQNPTGRTLSLMRRQQIAEILQRHDALLVEDDPYGNLRYRGDAVPTIKSLAPDHVVYISSLSKVFAPGLRIGFCVAPSDIQRWLVIARQGVDLHTSTFNQALAAEYLSGGYLQAHLPNIINLYRPKQMAMLSALDRYLPDGCEWTQPEGGMFIWVEGPPQLDMEQLYYRAVERQVAFVPGKFFYTEPGAGASTMRLNFTMIDEETIDSAVAVLGDVIQTELNQTTVNSVAANPAAVTA